MTQNQTNRVDRLEREQPVPVLPVPPLKRWWRRYLDRALTVAQLVDLATVIDPVEPVTADQLDRARVAYDVLWDQATGADLDKLRAMFGDAASGWAELVTN